MTNRTAQKKVPSKGNRKPKSGASAPSSRRLALGGILVVVLAIVVIIIVGLTKKAPSPATATRTQTAAAIRQATSVPPSAFESAGVPNGLTFPRGLPTNTPSLTDGGKPEVLYIGAEYCPFCAAQRWAMITALSRFGTFSGLGLTTSSTTDSFPNTSTFTFRHATYSSPYVAFVPVETQDNHGNALQQPTAIQQSLFSTYDAPPYTSQGGAIPFVLYGNLFVQVGAIYQPAVLAGMSQSEIAGQLADPAAHPAAAQIDGSANIVTAAICRLTNQQPSNVCSSGAVQQATSSLASG